MPDEEAATVYVLVRSDLPPYAQIVQACHACLEAGREFSLPASLHLVVLSVPDEAALYTGCERLEAARTRMRLFYEPDSHCLADRVTASEAGREAQAGYTAACSEPISEAAQKRLFRRYRLWAPSRRLSTT